MGHKSLLTVEAEAESILNSRLLTQNPDDPTNAEPVMPNRLLMLKVNQVQDPFPHKTSTVDVIGDKCMPC